MTVHLKLRAGQTVVVATWAICQLCKGKSSQLAFDCFRCFMYEVLVFNIKRMNIKCMLVCRC